MSLKKIAKVEVSKSLIEEILFRDRKGVEIYTVSTSSDNPNIINVFVVGDEFPEMKDGDKIPTARLTHKRVGEEVEVDISVEGE